VGDPLEMLYNMSDTLTEGMIVVSISTSWWTPF